MKKSVFLFVVVLSTLMFSCGNSDLSPNLSPNWSSDATPEQKRIIGELIESMILVEGGTFWMGAQATDSQGQNYDPDAEDWESPVHQVSLSDYYIGKYEVTQEQWQAVMESNPSQYKGSRNPVERVRWNDCQKFIEKLNKLTGLNFAFPTEAQWEYVARGGNKSQGYKYSGGNDLYSVGWFGYLNTNGDNKGNSGFETYPVGQKAPNELGIYDMSGNVWEWCQDRYDFYNSSSQTNPTGPSTGSCRMYRGGGCGYAAKDCRVSVRNILEPAFGGNFLGLRLVVNPK